MIAVIGSSNVDLVIQVKDFTLPGETQKGKKLKYHPGGKGANQAVAVKKLGGDVYFLSCVGMDGNGSFMLNELSRAGIDKGPITVESPNGLALIEVAGSGDNRIILYPGANELVTPEVIAKNEKELLKANILLLQNEIPFEATLYSAKLFHENGKLVIFDPAPAGGISNEILPYIDIITPNETEAASLVGGEFPVEETAAKLKAMGCPNIMLKRGDEGVVFMGEMGNFWQNAFKVEAVDTTAAGDIFNGAFAAALEMGYELQKAAQFASASSAIAVTREGAQPSIPTLEEVKIFLLERGVKL